MAILGERWGWRQRHGERRSGERDGDVVVRLRCREGWRTVWRASEECMEGRGTKGELTAGVYFTTIGLV